MLPVNSMLGACTHKQYSFSKRMSEVESILRHMDSNLFQTATLVLQNCYLGSKGNLENSHLVAQASK